MNTPSTDSHQKQRPIIELLPQALHSKMVEIRRHLHRHPELSWQEEHTADKVRAYLDQLGIRHRAVAGTGIIADISSPHEGPIIALRADLDALPVQEQTSLPFASETPGVMHACGHDGHTSMLLGAATSLAEETELPHPVRLLFQPAEELGEGAKAMIAEGALDGVSMIFGGHLDPHFPTGSIIVTDGPVNASSDRFTITIDAGEGGHGARPHEAVDAIVIGSLLVMAIQTIVSREINPAHPAVITVGQFQAGKAGNVITGHAELEGTIRSHHRETRSFLKDAVARMAKSIGQIHGAAIDVDMREGTPVLTNALEATAVARQAARDIVGEANVWAMELPSMGSEDFSYYGNTIPGCYVRFGATPPGEEMHPLHSGEFTFGEEALAFGAAYFLRVALISMA
jgi:amidohydrolase